MSKANTIIDGAGVTVTLGGSPIADIVEIGFSVFGERSKINLTTIDATKWEQCLYSDLQKIENITITKKSNPSGDQGLYSTSSQALVIAYKVGKSTTKNITFYVQVEDIGESNIERAPGDGVNAEISLFVTNLSGLTETGPAITTPA